MPKTRILTTLTVVATLAVGAASASPQARPLGPQDVRAGVAGAHVVCQEDQWCWNALLDGNHQGRYIWGQ